MKWFIYKLKNEALQPSESAKDHHIRRCRIDSDSHRLPFRRKNPSVPLFLQSPGACRPCCVPTQSILIVQLAHRPFCHKLSGEWSLRTVEIKVQFPFQTRSKTVGITALIPKIDVDGFLSDSCCKNNILYPLYIPFWSTLLMLGFYFETGAT